jgi:hypothetical protein
MMEEFEQRLERIQEAVKTMNHTVNQSLKTIEDEIMDIVENIRAEEAKKKSQGFKPSILLSFPDHLRLTVRALMKLGIATAKEVSQETGRSRSLESTYLNTLTTMKYVQKERKSRKVFYLLNFEKAEEVVGEEI